ncbi:MAG: hypothetical protein K2H63_04665 [Paramuribaculum sp.]|nr:hypothetical protein [Paramuribaculum sp.]
MKIQNKFIKIIFGFIVAILTYCIVGLVLKDQRTKSLQEHRIEAQAVVSEYYSISFTFYYKYKFNVNGKVYYGSEKRHREKDIPAIGDTILIEYDALSPKNNRVISINYND